MNDQTQQSVPCPACGGSGRDEFGECETCRGHGYVLRPAELAKEPAC